MCELIEDGTVPVDPVTVEIWIIKYMFSVLAPQVLCDNDWGKNSTETEISTNFNNFPIFPLFY